MPDNNYHNHFDTEEEFDYHHDAWVMLRRKLLLKEGARSAVTLAIWSSELAEEASILVKTLDSVFCEAQTRLPPAVTSIVRTTDLVYGCMISLIFDKYLADNDKAVEMKNLIISNKWPGWCLVAGQYDSGAPLGCQLIYESVPLLKHWRAKVKLKDKSAVIEQAINKFLLP